MQLLSIRALLTLTLALTSTSVAICVPGPDVVLDGTEGCAVMSALSVEATQAPSTTVAPTTMVTSTAYKGRAKTVTITEPARTTTVTDTVTETVTWHRWCPAIDGPSEGKGPDSSKEQDGGKD